MSNKHERLADRFADIFIRLNSNEKLSTKAIAKEYDVCDKTIRRDLNRMECYLPLVRERGVVYLDNTRRFNLTHKELSELLKLIGVHNLLPNMDIGFLRELIRQNSDSPYHIHHHSYENSQTLNEMMKQLDHAIIHRQIIHCHYDNKERSIHPYKLIFKEGYWYLVGMENEKLKNYRLGKIHSLSISTDHFVKHGNIEAIIRSDASIWLGQQEITVLINVSQKVISYFQQRQILPKQSIISEQAGGNWLVQSTVWHYDELSPIIRCWIPHLTIIEPKEWQDRLESELRSYLN
ncbi:WYL domain-containing protein [Moraxella haemolytica]|uniref:helix-turn-helix transcriptional regulator n=1 Tax=Moraxella haemolytica TaxID=2904119 RepID=UPI00254381DA|nr:WYL domain-containing transcriptional regulator [Moraxella sp. ZY171148]WII95506.1 WYL domain-containing protein [Moraxella sp. ZY171148]